MIQLHRFSSCFRPSLRYIASRMYSSGVTKTVLVETEGNVCLIGINRPETRNAVDPETARQLQMAFCAFEENPELQVAILYGKGGTFCSGWDLKQLSTTSPQSVIDSMSVGPMGPTGLEFSKPVLGALSGYAVAGGLELAILCDLRIAEKSSIMGVFNRRFGVPLIDGCTVRLPRLIGLSRALDLIMTGRPVGADEALCMGLVNRVVPDGKALDEAKKLAKLLASFPQLCLTNDRSSTLRNMYCCQSFDEAMRYELEQGLKVLREEAVEGAKRFADGTGRKGSFDEFTSKL